jgi:hypothetical protein
MGGGRRVRDARHSGAFHNQEVGIKHILRILCIVLAIAAVPGGGAAAQGRLQTGTSGTVPYASGGGGEAERAALEARSDEYNLRLTFTVHDTGAMLADVALTVDDVRQGRVFALAASGPLVYLKLPPGTYTVSATSKGVEQRRRITLDRSGEARELVLYWVPGAG